MNFSSHKTYPVFPQFSCTTFFIYLVYWKAMIHTSHARGNVGLINYHFGYFEPWIMKYYMAILGTQQQQRILLGKNNNEKSHFNLFSSWKVIFNHFPKWLMMRIPFLSNLPTEERESVPTIFLLTWSWFLFGER